VIEVATPTGKYTPQADPERGDDGDSVLKKKDRLTTWAGLHV
jgi:hypothetical protein